MTYIGENAGDDVNTDAVAARFNYSAFHFHRIFKQVTEMTVTDYIRERRLESAANALLDTGMNILDICLACGFENPQTFNRLFKRKFGVTPREFRLAGLRYTGVSPERILRDYYYRLAEGAYPMLKPYIGERGLFRLVGKRVTLGGSSPSKEEIGDLWENYDKITGQIHNTADEKVYGVSLEFYHADREEGARQAYMLAKEVSKVEHLGWDQESLIIPASRWLYIPVRYDDPFVKSLAPPEMQDDVGFLTGCVFGWAKLWCKENGQEHLDYPFEFEIYGLNDGYEGEGGANLTLAIPVK